MEEQNLYQAFWLQRQDFILLELLVLVFSWGLLTIKKILFHQTKKLNPLCSVV